MEVPVGAPVSRAGWEAALLAPAPKKAIEMDTQLCRLCNWRDLNSVGTRACVRVCVCVRACVRPHVLAIERHSTNRLLFGKQTETLRAKVVSSPATSGHNPHAHTHTHTLKRRIHKQRLYLKEFSAQAYTQLVKANFEGHALYLSSLG